MNNIPSIPAYSTDEKEHRKRLAAGINTLMRGGSNAISTVTLTENAAYTDITDVRLSVDGFIGFMPTTANAAAGLTSLYVTDQNKGSARINHENNAQTDRTYTLVLLGG